MKKLNEEQLDLVYKMYAQGKSRIEVICALDMKVFEFDDIYNNDKDLRDLINKAISENFQRDYQDNLRAKPDTNINKDELVQAIRDKIKSGKYTLRDIGIAWDILFPEDDYKRYKSNMDVQINQFKAQTERIKVENTSQLAESLSDEFMKILEESLEK